MKINYIFEYISLHRMKKFGIPCPDVQLLRKHILVMSFIGKDRQPAPKLKDANLSYEDLEVAYAQMEDVSYNMLTLIYKYMYMYANR